MILVIIYHSFVDLITNSSTELFVCDTDKSLEMVKDIVEKIINNYYDELGYDERPDIWFDPKLKNWNAIFKLPTIAAYNNSHWATDSYGFNVEKGNIILESAADNSVPYSCWDRIEEVLNARRYHLG